jgi:ABC-type multidrug transport system ATPase subunit
MDPKSRRAMWDLISSTMGGRAVILTTHVMEECEALCGRVGIMVGGRLRCLGSPAHLKAVHGANFQLDLNVPVGEQQDIFQEAMLQRWPNAKCIEAHGNALKFRLPRVQTPAVHSSVSGASSDSSSLATAVAVPLSVGSVFRWVESIKDDMRVSEYSVSETTLEQIFVGYAKQQEEETVKVAGIID